MRSSLFAPVAFPAENRCPLFREMLLKFRSAFRMTLRSMTRLTRLASRECAPRHASQNGSPAPTDAPRGAWTSRQPPGEDDDGPSPSRESCQLRLANHAHQPIDKCREAQLVVVRSIEIHCSHQCSRRRTSPRPAPGRKVPRDTALQPFAQQHLWSAHTLQAGEGCLPTSLDGRTPAPATIATELLGLRSTAGNCFGRLIGRLLFVEIR